MRVSHKRPSASQDRKLRAEKISEYGSNNQGMRIEEWKSIILRTKKAKHLYEAMCDIEVVSQGADDAYAALRDKSKWFAREYVKNRARIIANVHNMILCKTFPKRIYRTITIKGIEKDREIEPQPFNPWSIVTHTIKLVLEPVAERLLIYDASAGVRGKGQVFAARRIKRMIRRKPTLRYFVDTDIRKFYPSIPHAVAENTLRQYISDEDFMEVFHKVADGYDSGIEPVLIMEAERKKLYCQRWAKGNEYPAHSGEKRGVTIGDPISQIIGNIVLSPVDRAMTEGGDDGVKAKAYHRHCDDILMEAATKEDAFALLAKLNKEMNARGFVIKASAVVAPLADATIGVKGRWIDAAGYNFSRTNMRMRKATKQRMARKMVRVKSRKRMQELAGAYFGIAKWGKCRHLWDTIKNNSIMSFAEHGIKTEVVRKSKDGSRFFDCNEERISALAQERTPIVVFDFETGIKVKEHTDRCSVLFRRETDPEDIRRKFIHSSGRIIDKLEKARALEREKGVQIFPCHTHVFEVRLSGGRFTYDIE